MKIAVFLVVLAILVAFGNPVATPVFAQSGASVNMDDETIPAATNPPVVTNNVPTTTNQPVFQNNNTAGTYQATQPNVTTAPSTPAPVTSTAKTKRSGYDVGGTILLGEHPGAIITIGKHSDKTEYEGTYSGGYYDGGYSAGYYPNNGYPVVVGGSFSQRSNCRILVDEQGGQRYDCTGVNDGIDCRAATVFGCGGNPPPAGTVFVDGNPPPAGTVFVDGNPPPAATVFNGCNPGRAKTVFKGGNPSHAKTAFAGGNPSRAKTVSNRSNIVPGNGGGVRYDTLRILGVQTAHSR